MFFGRWHNYPDVKPTIIGYYFLLFKYRHEERPYLRLTMWDGKSFSDWESGVYYDKKWCQIKIPKGYENPR